MASVRPIGSHNSPGETPSPAPLTHIETFLWRTKFESFNETDRISDKTWEDSRAIRRRIAGGRLAGLAAAAAVAGVQQKATIAVRAELQSKIRGSENFEYETARDAYRWLHFREAFAKDNQAPDQVTAEQGQFVHLLERGDPVAYALFSHLERERKKAEQFGASLFDPLRLEQQAAYGMALNILDERINECGTVGSENYASYHGTVQLNKNSDHEYWLERKHQPQQDYYRIIVNDHPLGAVPKKPSRTLHVACEHLHGIELSQQHSGESQYETSALMAMSIARSYALKPDFTAEREAFIRR